MISYYPMKRKQLKWWKKLFFHMFVMAVVNAFILYRETRNENQKNNCNLASILQKVGEGFVEKGATPVQNYVTQATDSWKGTLLTEYLILARRHVLREYVKFVQRSLRVLLKKEKEKKLRGDVLIVKCHCACQSASNYITQSKTFCKYRKCALHRFLFLKIFIVLSMKFSYTSSGKMCSYLYSN
jgi:hypothetical protein